MGQSQGAQDESAMEVLPDLGRLALTCWDYAWPLRREYGPGGGAVERALDEAVERGFNAVRLLSNFSCPQSRGGATSVSCRRAAGRTDNRRVPTPRLRFLASETQVTNCTIHIPPLRSRSSR